jgi:hypothetical protein
MDAADTLARLHDVRDPATGVAEAVADALAGGSVGVLSALLAFILLRAVTKRLPTQREVVSAELTRARHLAPDQRLLAQAKLVDRIAPDISLGPGASGSSDPTRSEGRSEPWQRLKADLRDALYRQDPAIDLDRVEGEILRLLSSRGR